MEEMKTVLGVFDSFSRAQQAVEALLLRKYDPTDISVIAGNVKRSCEGTVASREETGGPETAARDTTTAGATGSFLGMLAGVTALSLPYVGPILAVGPMLGVLSGAITGGAHGGADLVAALKLIGVPDEDGHAYADHVRCGGALVIVRCLPHLAPRIAALLENLGHVDIDRVRRRAVPGNYPQGGLGGDLSTRGATR